MPQDLRNLLRRQVFPKFITIFPLLICLWLVFGYACQLLVNTSFFLRASYGTFETLTGEMSPQLCKQWTVFWLLFCLLSLVDCIQALPLYWLAKFLFLTWCLAPVRNNGSFCFLNLLQIIYGNRPLVVESQDSIHQGARPNAIDLTVTNSEGEQGEMREEQLEMIAERQPRYVSSGEETEEGFNITEGHEKIGAEVINLVDRGDKGMGELINSVVDKVVNSAKDTRSYLDLDEKDM